MANFCTQYACSVEAEAARRSFDPVEAVGTEVMLTAYQNVYFVTDSFVDATNNIRSIISLLAVLTRVNSTLCSSGICGDGAARNFCLGVEIQRVQSQHFHHDFSTNHRNPEGGELPLLYNFPIGFMKMWLVVAAGPDPWALGPPMPLVGNWSRR